MLKWIASLRSAVAELRTFFDASLTQMEDRAKLFQERMTGAAASEAKSGVVEIEYDETAKRRGRPPKQQQ